MGLESVESVESVERVEDIRGQGRGLTIEEGWRDELPSVVSAPR